MPASVPQSSLSHTANRFITFEGGEGGGKSTHIRLLSEALKAAGQSVRMTREPGGAPGAEDIRRLLVEGEPGRWTAETEALLHFAARADHLARVVRPALSAGQWVLSDRFVDSTIAYQGYGLGLDLGWLKQLRQHVVGETEPSLTIILDLPVETGLLRAARRHKTAQSTDVASVLEDRYEKMDRSFHQRLRDGFLAIAAAEPNRCKVVNADRPVEAVATELRSVVGQHFGIKLG